MFPRDCCLVYSVVIITWLTPWLNLFLLPIYLSFTVIIVISGWTSFNMAILARSSSNSQTTTATMQLQQQLPPNPLAHLSTSTLLTLISPALTNTLVFFSYLQLFLRSYALTTLVVLLSHSFKITRGLILNGYVNPFSHKHKKTYISN